jgi:lysophospholipase L1-like esterase
LLQHYHMREELNMAMLALDANALQRKVDAATKKLQCVALGGRIPTGVNGGSGDANRTTMEVQKLFNAGGRGGNIGGILPMMVNFRMDLTSTIEGANSMRIAASMLNPLSGNAFKYSFRGDINPLIGKGAILFADYGVDMDVTTNEQFLMRTSAQVSTAGYTMVGGSLPAHATLDLSRSHTDSIIPANETGDCGGRVHNNTSMVGGGYAPTNGANSLLPYTPACILGYSERPQVAVLVIGDSNAAGVGDAAGGDGQGCIGYIERGLRLTASGVTAGTIWAKNGAGPSIYFAGNAPPLFAAMEYHTHFLNQLSGNSFSVGGNLTLAIKQRTVIAWEAAKIRSLRTIQLESLPRTTDSGNTAVAVGWEVGGIRDQFNAWVKSIVGQKIDANGDLSANGVVYLDEYWEINDLVQDPATNLWLNASYTADGAHLSATAHALVATRIAARANALTIY